MFGCRVNAQWSTVTKPNSIPTIETIESSLRNFESLVLRHESEAARTAWNDFKHQLVEQLHFEEAELLPSAKAAHAERVRREHHEIGEMVARLDRDVQANSVQLPLVEMFANFIEHRVRAAQVVQASQGDPPQRVSLLPHQKAAIVFALATALEERDETRTPTR
jgi:hypothetical protein